MHGVSARFLEGTMLVLIARSALECGGTTPLWILPEAASAGRGPLYLAASGREFDHGKITRLTFLPRSSTAILHHPIRIPTILPLELAASGRAFG